MAIQLMALLLGIIIGLIVTFGIIITILLLEIRLLKTNSSITEKIATQLERLKPRGKVEIINPNAQTKLWKRIENSAVDVNLNDFLKEDDE